jgi:hypothetical protein
MNDSATRDHVRAVLEATSPSNRAARRAALPPKPPARIIHRKKFMDGRMTPDEVEASVMPIGKRCPCGAPPTCVARVFMPLDEVVKQIGQTELGRLLVEKPDEFQSLCLDLPQHGGVFVRASTAYSCRAHLPEMERQAAKAPSWCYVDIDRGPEVMERNRVVVGPTVFDRQE